MNQTLIDSAQTINIRNVAPRITIDEIKSQPSASCANIHWCRIIYQHGSDIFTMLDIFVLPFTDKGAGANSFKCWTLSRGKALDLISVTVIRVSALDGSNPTRIAANLLDGIYTFSMNECWITDVVLKPYVLYDLQTITTVSKVMVMAQKKNYLTDLFGNIEIRFGTTVVAGNDFSSYTLLGYYDGTPDYNEIYEAIPSIPASGRYLSIQRIDAVAVDVQICHLEIYS